MCTLNYMKLLLTKQQESLWTNTGSIQSCIFAFISWEYFQL